mgnify:FL=1
MKHIRYYIMALLALPLMASCGDDDYSAPTPAGNPVMNCTAPAAAVWMGDEVEVKVNCKDEGGVALSTLKANLLFSGQSVDETTIRTKEAGEYTVKLKVPYAQNVPDGKVDIQLTLQNVSTKSNTETLSFDIKRPHFNNLQFVSADGVKYDMTEKSDFVYQAVLPSSKKTFKGYFATKDGKFVFGSSTGKDICLGETGNFNFTSENMSDVVVTFDGKNYTAGPTDVLPVTILDFADSDAGKTWVGDIKQGATCNLTINGNNLPDDWYYDSDWFQKEEDGSYTFKAITGRYTILADFTHKSFRIWTMNGSEPMSLNGDGTGALWIIGNEGVNKPTWDAVNHSWWTGVDSDVCLTPIKAKVYQVTLTVGKQLRATGVDFKFFGQANWGIEFKGKDNSHLISTDSEVFGIGDGNGHDNGNVYLKDGVELKDGETYVLTVDLTAGVDKAVLKVEKK